jgi:flagellar export protein FliJ
MAFHFSLEAVLRVRRGQERVERQKLEAILSEEARTWARLEEVGHRQLELRRQFQHELGSGLAGSEVQYEALREASVASLIAALRTRLAELDQQHHAQAQIFIKARQRREVLENLRLRKLDLYRIDQARREQQELDDLFLMRQGTKSDE